MKVKEIMHGVTLVSLDSSVFDAARLMAVKNIGSVLVEREGVIKILNERDIIKDVVAEGIDPKHVRVSDIVKDCQTKIECERNLIEASRLFDQYDLRRLPVTKDGKLVGIVTSSDVAKSVSYAFAKRFREYDNQTLSRPRNFVTPLRY